MDLVLVSALAAAAVAAAPGASDRAATAASSACRDLIANADDVAPIRLKMLGELPPAYRQHAIYRVVRGCPVAEILVDGQTYYVPSIVRPDGGPVIGNRIIRRDHPGE